MDSLLIELGVMGYNDVHELQLDFLQKRISGEIDKDIFLVTEHPPVFTLGRRGNRSNFMVSEEFLQEQGVDVVHVERGGDVTFHGLGQIVVYPIFNLRQVPMSVTEYVENLEEAMILTAEDFGLEAGRDERNRGAWVGENKLGSIGIAVRRGVSYHGLALNVHISLQPFGWVNPCGLQGIGVTSLAQELSSVFTMAEVQEKLVSRLAEIFERDLIRIDLEELSAIYEVAR